MLGFTRTSQMEFARTLATRRGAAVHLQFIDIESVALVPRARTATLCLDAIEAVRESREVNLVEEHDEGSLAHSSGATLTWTAASGYDQEGSVVTKNFGSEVDALAFLQLPARAALAGARCLSQCEVPRNAARAGRPPFPFLVKV